MCNRRRQGVKINLLQIEKNRIKGGCGEGSEDTGASASFYQRTTARLNPHESHDGPVYTILVYLVAVPGTLYFRLALFKFKVGL